MRPGVLVVGMLSAAIMLTGCGERKQYGMPAGSTVPVVSLKAITENPGAYQGREVMLKGNYGTYCCPADFSYKEGLDGVAVASQGFASPNLRRGQPITVYGVVRVGRAPEVEESSSGTSETAAPVYIEAKGVALR